MAAATQTTRDQLAYLPGRVCSAAPCGRLHRQWRSGALLLGQDLEAQVVQYPSSRDRFDRLNDELGPAEESQRPDNSFVKQERHKFIRHPNSIAGRQGERGEIKLNFQNANVLEMVKVLLGDMLQATYVVDPRVPGISRHADQPPPHQGALIPTLELLLRRTAALLLDGNIYRVVPLANAATGVRAPNWVTPAYPARGYSVRWYRCATSLPRRWRRSSNPWWPATTTCCRWTATATC